MEMCVVACTAMRFTEIEALAYLKARGYSMCSKKYYYTRGHISAETRKRAFEHARSFLEDHINTIDELLNIKKMMYENYNDEVKPINKTMILAKITETMIKYSSGSITISLLSSLHSITCSSCI